MNTKHAKAPFSIKTLAEITKHLCLQIGLSRDQLYQVSDHLTGRLGYWSTFVRKLKECVPKGTALTSQASLLKLATNTSKLYNQQLLNMNKMITHENIERLEAQLKKNLEYFAGLREAQPS